MKVEILYFDGCPGHERVLPRLRELAGRHGAGVELRRVETAEQAEVERFLGSPTIRVDGVDIEPGASERTDFGFKCRLYPPGEGTPPTPPDEWIIDALEGAQ